MTWWCNFKSHPRATEYLKWRVSEYNFKSLLAIPRRVKPIYTILKELDTAGTTYLSHWKYGHSSYKTDCSAQITPYILWYWNYTFLVLVLIRNWERIVLAFKTSPVSELLSHVGFSRLFIFPNIWIDLHHQISSGERNPVLTASKLLSFPSRSPSLANTSPIGFDSIKTCFRPSTQSRKKSAPVVLLSQQVWARKTSWHLLTLMTSLFQTTCSLKYKGFFSISFPHRTCPLAPRWKYPNITSHLLANE